MKLLGLLQQFTGKRLALGVGLAGVSGYSLGQLDVHGLWACTALAVAFGTWVAITDACIPESD